MNVLLVDDSKSMRDIHKKVLAAELGEVRFFEAGDCVEALSIIAATPEGFGLILIERDIPNMDGITLITRIRERDKVTPLIMATTESGKSRVIEAIRAGVNNYLVKPFTPELLAEKVRQTLEKQKAA